MRTTGQDRFQILKKKFATFESVKEHDENTSISTKNTKSQHTIHIPKKVNYNYTLPIDLLGTLEDPGIMAQGRKDNIDPYIVLCDNEGNQVNITNPTYHSLSSIKRTITF